MKRLKVIWAAALLIASLTACGETETSGSAGADANDAMPTEKAVAKTETSEDEKPSDREPVTLVGQWTQDGQTEGESRMVALIRDDGKIGVFFDLEDDPDPWTYWVGTYDAPTDSKDEHTWISKNTYGGNGLLASGDDEKEFRYKDGKLSFEVTIQEDTKTVDLVRGEWDASTVPESAFGSVNAATTEVKDLEITDSGWCAKNGFLKYYVSIHNPNEDIAVEFPSFRITGRDADGALVDTEDQTLSIIYPGQDFFYGSQSFEVGEMPATVDFEIIPANDNNLKAVDSLVPFIPLVIEGTTWSKDKCVGEVKNPNDYDIETAAVVVVSKDADGNMVDADVAFVDNVPAGGTAPFSVTGYDGKDVSECEFYANQW